MSELDKKLSSVQNKGTTLKLVVGAFIGILLLGYMAILLLAKGYAINVFPEQANRSKAISVIEGSGFIYSESAYSFTGEMKIQVSADKYLSKEVTIEPNSNSTIEVELEPSPGSLIVKTTPEYEGTIWKINQKLVHVGTNLQHALPHGEYTLTIDNKYYQAVEKQISISSEEETLLNIELTPIESSMTFTSNPFGANITINDQQVGKTPLTLPVSGGYFEVITSKDGFEDTVDTIEVTNTSTEITRNYKLAPKKALALISASPSDGVLLINGQEVFAGENYVDANKTHTVMYTKDGYYTHTEKLKLTPGEYTEIDISLKPEYGKVAINSSPSAGIYIDGKLVANGAFSTTLSSVKHTIKLAKQGYRSVTKVITPSSKTTNKVNVKLITEFDARRQEGQPLFISKLGIEMASFAMSSYKMGSPVNEKGRMRNEHQISVDFNKPVLMGRHEITEAQFKAFAPDWDNTSLPVTEVTWNDAAIYCNWLSEQEGLPFFYIENEQGNVIGFNQNAIGYRLPTEAEWEWVVRMSNRAIATKYTWGNLSRAPKESGNFGDASIEGQQTFVLKKYNDGFEGKSPIGSFKADRAGMFDMTGNVSEWVHDYFSHAVPNTKNTHLDYLGANRGMSHIVKGGSYKTGRISKLRGSFRTLSDRASETIGFRIARYQ